ncbi:peptidoglycan bridge formation glycyltransferase FemA/FemB family protein [Candidatus Gottesmanbacteria bacterium]|nr:peptidoglycan bridge formation glycyltransferase FemA/FemB family protein [Candidatus Gottesmanbacteria bacterium]
MDDIRQSLQYAQFMRDLGWKVEKIGESYAYIRRFPLLGSFIKIQRIKLPIPLDKIEEIRKKYRAFKVQIAPNVIGNDGNLERLFLKHGYKIDHSPNIPTKTIHIDLRPDEEIIFSRFSEAKRRAVRRAIKNIVVVKESDDIEAFIKIRTQRLFPMGFFVRKEMLFLWEEFYPKNLALLIIPNLAGVLLLFHNSCAYYWYAASTDEGKHLFAPTLLVWETLKMSKKRGARIFDFEGMYDERFPKATNSWKGFSKFKEGFGGQIVEFLPNFCK